MKKRPGNEGDRNSVSNENIGKLSVTKMYD